MCLLFLDFQNNPKYPLVLGANREENSKRPMFPPAIVDQLQLVAGIDRSKTGESFGIGTWAGINLYGLIVAVTNRDDCKGHNVKNMSRGLLCNELLACTNPLDAVALATKRLMSRHFKSCNFLIANQEEAYVVHGKAPTALVVPLNPGFHVLTNLDVNDPYDKRILYTKNQYSKFTVLEEYEYLNMLSDPNIIINDDKWGTICSSLFMVNNKNDLVFNHCHKKPENIYERYVRINNVLLLDFLKQP